MQDSLFGLGSEENFNVASLPSPYFLEPNEYRFKGGFVKARICVGSQLFVKFTLLMIWTRWVVVTQLVVAECLSPTLLCCQLAISKMSISGIARRRLRAKISGPLSWLNEDLRNSSDGIVELNA